MNTSYDLSDFGKGGRAFIAAGIVALLLSAIIQLTGIYLGGELVFVVCGFAFMFLGVFCCTIGHQRQKDKVSVLFYAGPQHTERFEVLFNSPKEAEHFISTMQVPDPQVKAVAEEEQLLIKKLYPRRTVMWEAAKALTEMRMGQQGGSDEH